MDIVIRNIINEFIVVNPDKKAAVEPADGMLYQRIEKNYKGFKSHELESSYEFNSGSFTLGEEIGYGADVDEKEAKNTYTN